MNFGINSTEIYLLKNSEPWDQARTSYQEKSNSGDVFEESFMRLSYQRNALSPNISNTCEICMKSFAHSRSLRRHRRNCGERPYRCEICKKSYIYRSHLQCHMRTHSGEKPYKCVECTKSFAKGSHLRRHLRTHTGEKPFSCEICKKSFTQSVHLRFHMRIHTGEKPYNCEVCKKSFVHNGDLRSHLRTHTGEKPYTCEFCKKSFTRRAALNWHMKTHFGGKRYMCSFCQKLFQTKYHLTRHLRVHTGEKPYNCEICKKSFACIRDVQIHLKTHTSEKPNSLEICENSFAKSSTVACHGTIHATEKPNSDAVCMKPFTDSVDLPFTGTRAFGNPYSCETCKKTFVSQQMLKLHLSSHTEEKPSACEAFMDLMSNSVDNSISHGQHLLTRKSCKESFLSEEELRRYSETSDLEKPCRESSLNDRHRLVMHLVRLKCIRKDKCNTSTVAPSPETISDLNYSKKSDSEESTLTAKLYGCGICDDTFFSEKAFLEHCMNHESHIYVEV